MTYHPAPALIVGVAPTGCSACVVVPARDEEGLLDSCLDALLHQETLQGAPLSHRTYEVLLLLNNCADQSASFALRWQLRHPSFALHVVERTFSKEQAHAGTARKLLLDTAFQRLGGLRLAPVAMLCTDADSTVAPDWLAQNLAALGRGADAVGGLIELDAGNLQSLPDKVRRCYERDCRYGQLVAHLEALLDPQPGDPWPRHQHHFGSSLACTPQAYALAGGMPAAPVLEDEAFVHQLRRAGLRLRHEPAVRIATSARLDGRAEVGLAGQLRHWNELSNEKAHQVQSAPFLAHRFSMLSCLRAAFRNRSLQGLHFPTEDWHHWASACLREQGSVPDFLAALDADGLIDATFEGQRQQKIGDAIAALQAGIAAFSS